MRRQTSELQRSLGLLLASVGALAGSVRAGVTITLRSGQVMGAPGVPIANAGPNDDIVRAYAGLAATAMTINAAAFASADAAPPALLVDSGPWLATLPCDANARWINCLQSGVKGVPRSTLYAVPFTVPAPTPISGTMTLCWAVDDRLGDPPGVVGVYMNGVALDPGFSGGGAFAQTTFTQVGVPLQANNTLYIYQRDTGAIISGLIFSCTIVVDDPVPVCAYGAPTWNDSFDGYTTGSVVNGQGGWEMCATPVSLISSAHASSAPNSVAVARTQDLVQPFLGYTSGKWTFRVKQYLPGPGNPDSLTEPTWFRLLHEHFFPCFGFLSAHQSVELEFDPPTATWNLYNQCLVVASGPIAFDQWVELRAEIDLDNDLVEVFYGGVAVAPPYSWHDDGPCPGGTGPRELQGAKFSAYGSDPNSTAYYDCASLSPYQAPVVVTVVAGGSSGLTVTPKVAAVNPNDVVVATISNTLAHSFDGGGRIASYLYVTFLGRNPTTGPWTIYAPINPSGGPDTEIYATMSGTLSGTYPYDAELMDQNWTSLCTIDPQLVAGAAISVYCTGKTNSQGCTPAVGYVGAPSPDFGSGFTLSATNVLNNKFGLLFYGVVGSAAIPFQGGILCVKPPIKRTTVQSSNGNPPPNDCSGAFTFDFNVHIAAGLDPALGSGTTVNAQYWYRDPGFAPPDNTGLSNAIQFTIP